MKALIRALSAVVIAVCLLLPKVHASVVISGTRVVFDATRGEATVRLTNQNKRPALVQAWIDTGDPHSTPDSVQTPFLITPPLFRMDAGREQSLRIIHIQDGESLPTDRESLFWLNVLEVPPKPTDKAAERNMLRFAIRTRIKLFYRPGGLALPNSKATEQLTWSVTNAGQDIVLQAHNPTPYYITFSKVVLDVGDREWSAPVGMVAPFGSLDLPVPELESEPEPGTTVVYSTVNDFGAVAAGKGVITQ